MAIRRIKWWAMVTCGGIAFTSLGMIVANWFWIAMLGYGASNSAWMVFFQNGRVYFLWEAAKFGSVEHLGWIFYCDHNPAPSDWKARSYVWLASYAITPSSVSINIPFWMIAFPPLVTALFLYTTLRVRKKGCACGYDLTGLPTGASCPECGAPDGADAQQAI